MGFNHEQCMIIKTYKTFDFRHSKNTGGKAGKGHNRTKSIQVWSEEKLTEAIEHIVRIYGYQGEWEITGTSDAGISCSKIVKEYAIDFAEYIRNGKWDYHPDFKIYINSNDFKDRRTIDEIYALFLREQE